MMKKRNWLFIVLWVIFSLPILLVIGITLSNKSSSTIEISQQQFEKILQRGDAREVVLVRNQHFVEVTLTEEALNKSEYQKKVEAQDPFSVAGGSHYMLKIVSSEIFDQNFTEIQEKTPLDKRMDYRVEERSGIESFLLNWGFIFSLLSAIPILALWLIFKLFWSTKPKEKSVQNGSQLSSNGSDPAENHQLNFPVKIGDRTIFLEMNKIVSFQAKDNYVNISDTEDNHYLIEHTLHELEGKLPSQFVRIHRSYIVNKLLIKEIRKHSGNRFTLLLNGKKLQQLVSSQSYAPKVKELMKF